MYGRREELQGDGQVQITRLMVTYMSHFQVVVFYCQHMTVNQHLQKEVQEIKSILFPCSVNNTTFLPTHLQHCFVRILAHTLLAVKEVVINYYLVFLTFAVPILTLTL